MLSVMEKNLVDINMVSEKEFKISNLFNSWFTNISIIIVMELAIFLKWYEYNFSKNTKPIGTFSIILWIIAAILSVYSVVKLVKSLKKNV